MGAVVMRISGRAHVSASAPRASPWPHQHGCAQYAEWKKQLDLTDDQTAKLTSVSTISPLLRQRAGRRQQPDYADSQSGTAPPLRADAQGS